MNNEELLITLKDMFEKKVDEVKRHTGVLIEDLRRDVKVVAEGHDILDRKIGNLDKKIDNLHKELTETRQELRQTRQELKQEINSLEKDMTTVRDYVIGVDEKLNEHETILKRVK